MLAKISCAALLGVDAFEVNLEADFTRGGIPSFSIVGLAEGAVKEASSRVFTALRNSSFTLPSGRITINLAPADFRKDGSAYDLPLALALLAAAGILKQEQLEGIFCMGELSLTGEIRPVPGVLSVALLARAKKARALIIPKENAQEAAIVSGLSVYGVNSLPEAVAFLQGIKELKVEEAGTELHTPATAFDSLRDFAEVKGQEHAKRAIEIAAAGGHNILLVGPPGSGKTMLAQRVPGVLPPLSFEEALEVTKIYSVAGKLARQEPVMRQRPFRSPHHTISPAGLVGGTGNPKPGEISLAHRGVLFLDELPEFPKTVLEVLRQPLEDGKVNISRAMLSVDYPARFMLVAAMNPCPCGYLGDANHTCTCSAAAVQRYRSKLSGPLLDRIDMHIEVPAVPYSELRPEKKSTVTENRYCSTAIRGRVTAARALQEKRYQSTPCHCNAELNGSMLEKYCGLGEAEHNFLGQAVTSLALSARSYTRILRLARTIADLAQMEQISVTHLAEAINCRVLDREN